MKTLKEKESALAGTPDADALLKKDITAKLCSMDQDEAKPLGVAFYESHNRSSVSDRAAAITQAQYDDFIKRYQPQIDAMYDRIGNQEYQGDRVGKAVDSSLNAYNSGLESAGRSMARYGVNLDPQKRESFDRQAGIGRALSTVTAANNTRNQLDDEDFNSMMGLAEYGRGTLSDANQLFSHSAGLEQSRNATNDAISAQNSAANKQAAMTAAAALMMMV